MMRAGAEERVAAITHVYLNASTSPCRVTTEAGGEWVMKLRGAGPGPIALLTELLALRIARSMGLEVPIARPLYLPAGFPWSIGTDEFDGIVQRSFGWNLGISFLHDALPAEPEKVLGADPEFLGVLAEVDRLLSNTDRSVRNTNVLAAPSGLVAIDFDACLFLRRAARGAVPTTFPLPGNHLLHDLDLPAPARFLDPDIISEALRDAPPEWLVSTGLSEGGLAANLTDYAAAWNASSPVR
jgi:hypothetical protein